MSTVISVKGSTGNEEQLREQMSRSGDTINVQIRISGAATRKHLPFFCQPANRLSETFQLQI